MGKKREREREGGRESQERWEKAAVGEARVRFTTDSCRFIASWSHCRCGRDEHCARGEIVTTGVDTAI